MSDASTSRWIAKREIAVRYDRSLYDSLYLALSAAVDAPLVTADLRFFRALSSTRLGKRMMWVEELPA